MIIQIESPDASFLDQARSDLQRLVGSWGHEITSAPSAAPAEDRDTRAVDPVALASLVVSLPSAALAVADLADRIRKRRRAAELVDHAREEAARQVTIFVVTSDRATRLADLTPDQVLELPLGDLYREDAT